MSEVLNVTVRKSRGTRAARRERASGHVPAILYGHHKDNVALCVPSVEIEAAIRHGARVVDLKGEVSDSALISAVQWDAFGVEVLHLDLIRVEAGERVKTTVTVELRGEAPGVKDGGRLNMVTHELDVECAVSAVTDRLPLSVNALQVGQSIHAHEVPLPEGMVLLSSAEAVVVQCVAAVEEEEEAPTAALPVEPERIGRKAGEDESES